MSNGQTTKKNRYQLEENYVVDVLCVKNMGMEFMGVDRQAH